MKLRLYPSPFQFGFCALCGVTCWFFHPIIIMWILLISLINQTGFGKMRIYVICNLTFSGDYASLLS